MSRAKAPDKARVAAMSRRTIEPGDAEWPVQVNELGPCAPPQRLHLAGARLDAGSQTVAIVGSRRPTAAGVEAARRLAGGLADADFGIVSGLAVGIDTAAHKAAISAGGYTIAVLGCGLDVEYPRCNSALRREIAATGTLVTEYADGTPPLARNFPDRNRIIAGLSAAVVFVEGGERSGGLITARRALDANRYVFAVPGSMRNSMAIGPNELIRTSQASLVTDVWHICEELAPGLVWKRQDGSGNAPAGAVEESEQRVLDYLDDAPVGIEAICNMLGMSLGAVSLAVSRLEVRGYVSRRIGGYEITSAGSRLRERLRARSEDEE
jgi:DNA processing protein